jgi:DNA primase
MVRLLWQRETDGKDYSSPERQAALEARLTELTSRIKDRLIADRYRETLKRLKSDLFWNATARVPNIKGKGKRKGFKDEPAPAMPSTRASLLVTVDAPQDALREAVILATLLRFPELLSQFETWLERLDLSTEDHSRLRNLLLTHGHSADCLALIRADSPAALDRLVANPHVLSTPHLGSRASADYAAACIEETFARLLADRAHRVEVAEAICEAEGLTDEGQTWRISHANLARETAARGPQESNAEVVIAPNGVVMSKEEIEYSRKSHASIDPTRGGKSRH